MLVSATNINSCNYLCTKITAQEKYYFGFPLSTMDRSSRQKIDKEAADTEIIMSQVDLTPMRLTATYSLKCTWNILQD